MESKPPACEACKIKRRAFEQASELTVVRDKLARIAAVVESRYWGEAADGSRLDVLIRGILREHTAGRTSQ